VLEHARINRHKPAWYASQLVPVVRAQELAEAEGLERDEAEGIAAAQAGADRIVAVRQELARQTNRQIADAIKASIRDYTAAAFKAAHGKYLGEMNKEELVELYIQLFNEV